MSALIEKYPIFTSLSKIPNRCLHYYFNFVFRGTFGGCFSTTLGGLIHELGHMLDLGHTENGMMSRGCDDVDKFFTLSTSQANTTEGKTLAQKQRQLLANCSRYSFCHFQWLIAQMVEQVTADPRVSGSNPA